MCPLIRSAAAAAAMSVLIAAGCRPVAPSAPIQDVVVVSATSVPIDPTDAAWQAAPELVAKLIPQDLVEPRQMQASTSDVRVRAVTDGSRVSFRLEWTDDSDDNLPKPGQFADACAVQIPAKLDPTVPAPQMGEPGKPVEITFWTAAWQAIVDGRGDTLQDIYPNATVDHYPFQAKPLEQDPAAQREMAVRYAPARALGNNLAGPRETPVQDLVAEGPGTLNPAPTSASEGHGQRTANGWSVVITRPLPAGLSPQSGSQIAFAVWQGAQEEVGARKMRTGWINLALRSQP